MTVKASAIKTLYRAKRITIEGVHQAVENGLITVAEFEEISGKEYK